MLRSRIIPCLLMHEGSLIKTRKFGDPKYVGDPINAVKIYNEKEVDELVLFDISAWRSGEPNFRVLEKIAVESRMPLCYGGGITTVEQARRMINLGYEKISISAAAIENPALVAQLADAIGSQSIVVTFDVRPRAGGGYSVFTQNGKRHVSDDLPGLCQQAVAHGAGELVIQSIEREGERIGYDLELADMVARQVALPLTFLGGAGTPAHMAELIDKVGTVGVGVGTMFVLKGPFRAVLISFCRP